MKVLRVVVLLPLALIVCARAEAQTVVKMTLEEARETAVKSHPQIKVALFNAMAAEHVPDQLRAAKYPNVASSFTTAGASENANLSAGGLSNSSVLNRAATGVTVNQLIFDFGRNDSLVSSASSRAKSVEQTAEAIRAQIIFQVDRAYFTTLRAQALLKVAEQTVATRQVVVDQTKELQKSGIKSGLDVSVADYSLAESKLLLVRAQNDLRSAFADLSAAIGSSAEQTFELVDEYFPIEPLPGQDQMINEALRNRPELRALQFDRDASFESLRAEKALKKPSVSAVWNAGVVPFRDKLLAAFSRKFNGSSNRGAFLT